MRTQTDQFIMKDFGYLDSGITSAIGTYAELVYERIRRKSWRTGRKKGDLIIATENQAEIAEIMNVSRMTVNRAVASLELAGWLKVEGEREHTRYILGTHPEDFWADQKCLQVWSGLEELAISRGMVNKEGDPAVKRLPPSVRKYFCQQFFSMENGKPLEEQLSLTVTTCNSQLQPLVTDSYKDLDLVTHSGHMNREEGLIENLIEKNGIRPSGGSLATPEGGPPERSEGGLASVGVGRTSPESANTWSEEKDPAPVTHRVSRLSPEEMEDLQNRVAAKKKQTDAQAEANLKRDLAREAQEKSRFGTGKVVDHEDPHVRKAVTALEKLWLHMLNANYPDEITAKSWTQANRGQVMTLFKHYKRGQVEAMFEYVLGNWNAIREAKKLTPARPTIAYVLKLHETLVPEAEIYSRVKDVLQEWDTWWAANPGKFSPPHALNQKYQKHVKEIERLGLLRKA